MKIRKLLLSFLAGIALIFELLPNGVVLRFMNPEGEPWVRTYSYFSLVPYGYANFGPLIAAVLTCVLIILTIVVFSRLEAFVLAHSRNINLYVEYESTEDLSQIIGKIKSQDIRIFDVEISKARSSETQYPNAIFSLQLPKKKPHTVVMTAIAEIETVRAIEEL